MSYLKTAMLGSSAMLFAPEGTGGKQGKQGKRAPAVIDTENKLSVFYDENGEAITAGIGAAYRKMALTQQGDNPENDLSFLSDNQIEQIVRRVPGDGNENEGAIDKMRVALVLAEKPPTPEQEAEDYERGTEASQASALGKLASKELNEDLVKYADARETLAGGPVIIAYDFAHNPNYQTEEGSNYANKLDMLPVPGSRYDDDDVVAAKKRGITIETDYYQYTRDGKKKVGQRWREWVEATERGSQHADVISLLRKLKEDYNSFSGWDALVKLSNGEENRDTLGLGKGQVQGAIQRWVTRVNTMTNRVRQGERVRRICDRIDNLARVSWQYAITDRFDESTTLATLRKDSKRPNPFVLCSVVEVDKKTNKPKGKQELSDAMSVGSFVNLKLDKAIAVDGGTFQSIMATKVRASGANKNKGTSEIPQSPNGAQAESMMTALHNVFAAKGKAYADLVVSFQAKTAKAERKTLGEIVGMFNDFFEPMREQWTAERIEEKEARDKAKIALTAAAQSVKAS